MRIVPLVTKESQIVEAERLCRGRKLMDLRPYQARKTGVIITGSEVYSGRIQDKFEPVVRKKLAKYPGEIMGVKLCDDDLGMITAAAKGFLTAGADFLIFTGGMSVDPDDLTPTAIRQLGAEIVTHGVPSQPGNMTLVAYLGSCAILGVPGAAISLPTTMFDVLLPQIYTGDRLTKQDLVNLGEGGLCQQCKACHFPTAASGDTEMLDKFGREITYLRLSVTDLCNLRCRYCMPEEGVPKKDHAAMLTEDEMILAVEAAASLGITKLRITGGEPLVKKNILSICRRAARVPGIREVCMTTNGLRLPELAVPSGKRG